MNSDCKLTSIGLFGILKTQGAGSSLTSSAGVGECSFILSLDITLSRFRGTRPVPLKTSLDVRFCHGLLERCQKCRKEILLGDMACTCPHLPLNLSPVCLLGRAKTPDIERLNHIGWMRRCIKCNDHIVLQMSLKSTERWLAWLSNMRWYWPVVHGLMCLSCRLGIFHSLSQ